MYYSLKYILFTYKTEVITGYGILYYDEGDLIMAKANLKIVDNLFQLIVFEIDGNHETFKLMDLSMNLLIDSAHDNTYNGTSIDCRRHIINTITRLINITDVSVDLTNASCYELELAFMIIHNWIISEVNVYFEDAVSESLFNKINSYKCDFNTFDDVRRTIHQVIIDQFTQNVLYSDMPIKKINDIVNIIN